jgi:hypothetical protein
MTTMIQRSFTGGEIAPSLYARTDTIKYATGLRTCRNFMVMRHGGVTNRPGTISITEVVDSTKRTRVMPFVFSNDQTYVLEVGHDYIRIIDGDEFVASVTENSTDVVYGTNYVAASDNTYGLTFAVATVASSAGYATNDLIFIGDSSGLNVVKGKVSGTTGTEIHYTKVDGTPYFPGAFSTHPSPRTIMKAQTYASVKMASTVDFSAGNTVTVVDNGATNTYQATVTAVTATEVRVISPATGLIPIPAKLTTSLNPGTIAKDLKVTTTYTETEIFEIQFVQSADVITIVHPNHKPAELSRLGAANWTLADITFAPLQAAPTAASITNGTLSGGGNQNKVVKYAITALSSDTYEESLSNLTGTADLPGFAGEGSAVAATTGYKLSWTGASGAVQYNIYRSDNSGTFGFISSTTGTTFSDSGIDPDITLTPPISRNPFNASGDYPAAVSYFQQRRTFANTNNNPEKVWCSRSGSYNNFTTSIPIQSDDAITFTLVGREVNRVLHLLELGTPVVFTSGGEWELQGDSSGVLKPAEINPKQHTYNGSSTLPPIIIGGSAVYVQGRGSIIRDLSFDYQVDGYRGSDLTIFSAHLFDGYTFVDWAYQQTPHSILWVVRDDGVLLGLTYVKEHQVVGWHHHDFQGGLVESITVIPNGTEDAVYMVMKRGAKRYIERLATRQFSTIEDAIFMDAALTYDGRNTTSTTMTLSGGSTWAYDESLTLTASASFFLSTDVGNSIFLTGSDGSICRFTITSYTSATVVHGKPNKDVPSTLRTHATATWSRAVDQLAGLDHLEGEDVSVLGDGFVIANPSNSSYDVITVTDGMIDLDRPYAVVTVGLPIVADLQTLDLDVNQGETISDKKELVTRVNVQVEASRGIWAGTEEPEGDDLLDGLFELKMRNAESNDDPIELTTGKLEVNLSGQWNNNGRVFIRQIDPLPLSILSIAPAGQYAFKNQGS